MPGTGVDAGSVYSSIRIRLNQLDQDLKGVYSRLDALESQITQKMDKPTKAVTASFNAMSLAGVAAFLGIGNGIKNVVSIYADFEQKMANVASVAGASSADFDLLTESAQRAGETTRFTASQAADALYYMASAGYSAQQSVDALSGVLSLAQATGSDLAATSSTMAAAISQFGLKAGDAGRVANVFAAAITSSQANMDKLTSGLRQVGPVAGTLGISLEEVTANLDALFNKGFQGEQAGTAIRSILLDLVDPSSEVVKKLKEQGVEYDKVNPKVVGLTGAFENMAEAGTDLTTVFGKVSASEALALIDTAKKSTGNLKDLETQITNTNKAAEAEAKQNDTLRGSLDLLKSATEATGDKFGKEFTPILRTLTQAAITVVGAIGKIPTPLLAIAGSAAAVIASISGITGALSLMGVTLSLTAPVIAGIGVALTAVATAATLTAKYYNDQKNVTEQLNIATINLKDTSKEYNEIQNELSNNVDKLTEAEKALLENRKNLLAMEMVKQLNDLAKNYDNVNKFIDKQNKLINTSQETISKYKEGLQNLADRLKESGESQEYISEAVSNYAGTYSRVYNKALESNISATETLNKAQSDLSSSIISIAQAVVDGVVDISQYAITNKNLYDVIIKQVEAIRSQNIAIEETGNVSDNAASKMENWQNVLQKALNLEALPSKGADAVRKYTANLNDELEKSLSSARLTGKEIASVYEEYANDISNAINTLIMSGEYTADESTIQSLVKLLDDIKEKKEAISETDSAREQAMQEFYKWEFDTQINNLEKEQKAKDEAHKKDLERLAKQKEVMNTVWSEASNALGSYSSLITALYARQEKLLKQQLQNELEAAGVAEKTAVEKAEIDLEAAKKTGDEKNIKEAQDALTRAKIQEEYAEKLNELQYQSAMIAWGFQLAQTTASAGMSIIKAFNAAADMGAAFPIVAPIYEALAVTAGAASIAAVAAAMPVKGFATGGIVDGTSYTGDNVLIRANSGEVVSTQEQFSAMYDMINQFMNGGTGGDIVINLTSILDGQILAESTTRYQKSGKVKT